MGLLVLSPDTKAVREHLNDQFDERSDVSGRDGLGGARRKLRQLYPYGNYSLWNIAEALQIHPPGTPAKAKWRRFLETHLERNYPNTHHEVRDAIKAVIDQNAANNVVKITFDHVEDNGAGARAVIYDALLDSIGRREKWVRHITLITSTNY